MFFVRYGCIVITGLVAFSMAPILRAGYHAFGTDITFLEALFRLVMLAYLPWAPSVCQAIISRIHTTDPVQQPEAAE